MQKKSILLSLSSVLLLFVLFSCGNKTTDTPEPAKTCLLTTLQEVAGAKLVFSYDNQNRLSKFDFPIDSLYQTYTYYGSDSIVSKLYDYGNTLISKNKLVLNAQGYISVEGTSTYTYSADGYLSKETSPFSTINYTVTSENYTKSEELTTSGSTSTHTYTYYTDKEEKLGLYAPNNSILNIRYGKGNKNLIKSHTIVNVTTSGTSTQVLTYTYEFDSENRPTKVTEITTVDGGTPSTLVTDLTYTCK